MPAKPKPRTAISKKPDKLIKQELAALRSEDKLTPDLVFRDPCILDFLGLKGHLGEKDRGRRRMGRQGAAESFVKSRNHRQTLAFTKISMHCAS